MGARFVELSKSAENPVPGESGALGPVVWLGMNSDDNLVSIRKFISGKTFERDVHDPDVVDQTVAKWIEYRAWAEI